MNKKKLIRKRLYDFEHKRKGKFVGEFMQYGEGGLLQVRIDTSIGSGSEWIAHAKMQNDKGEKLQPDWSIKILRPELIKSVKERSN